MNSIIRLRRVTVSALGAAVLAGAPMAYAQMVQPLPGARANDPTDALSMHLRTLAANPRNLFALLGAGRAAVDVGDPNAALGFFARAEEIDPRNARAKAGLATALVMLERPDDALRLFGEAVALGMPEGEIARDRGLAYDLRGDNVRAQKDYAIALRRGPDDEVTRRYALSLGISGDRTGAMTLLDPLLRKQDQAAWRARAFVMAMNDDVPGADAIARQVMPANLAGTMSPFLARLARLNPAERAHAVNFGTMPSDGQSFAAVAPGDPFHAIGSTGGQAASDRLIPAGQPLGPRSPAAVATPVAQPLSREPRRRPGQAVAGAATPPKPPGPGFSTAPTIAWGALDTRVGARIAAIDPKKLPPEARGEGGVPVRLATTVLPPPDTARAIVRVPVAGISPPVPVGAVAKPTPVGPPAAASATAVFEVASPRAVPASAPVISPPSPARRAPPVARLANILAGIEPEPESVPVALPSAAELRAARRAATRKAAEAATAAAAEKAANDAKAAALAAERANPARLWVQVATGSNERGLTTTWRRIREANATLLKGYGGYAVAFKATNRVLAGPVRSAADARALVKALAKSGVQATTFGSDAGQEVVKLAAK